MPMFWFPGESHIIEFENNGGFVKTFAGTREVKSVDFANSSKLGT